MKDVAIKSSRFNLKTLTADNVSERYMGWINNSENIYINYTSRKHNFEELRSYIKKREEATTTLFLGIFVRSNGEHIGNIKYEPINFKNRQATMGILIGEDRWRGKGVASEVIKGSALWLLNKFDINKILLGVDEDNIGAIKAYTKSGFKKKKYISSKNQIIMQFNVEK